MPSLESELKFLADPKKAQIFQRFFKTGEGQYAQGDVFLGIKVPETRKVAKKYSGIGLVEIKKTLQSKIHENRLAALLILVQKTKKANEKTKKELFDFYLENTKWINNWDLVDLSAEHLVGAYLLDKDKKAIYQLAKSNDLWEKRIAVISTFAFIKKNRFEETFKVAEMLLNDKHDLIHKAVGWMLRETGKRNLKAEEEFLQKHYKKMPRTMLRYAIEKFPETKRQAYLKGKK